MRQTLFHIPETMWGLPLFGAGLLLAVWAVASVGLLLWLVRRQGFNSDTQSYFPLLALVGLAIYFLLPAISEAHRGVPIRGYGVMVLLGIGSGAALAVYRGQLRGLDVELLLSLAFWMFITGIIGARAFYVIQKWDSDHFQKETLRETIKAVFNISQGGLVVFGSLITMIPTAFVFLRKYRLPLLATGDVIAPGVVLALAIGRIGCLMNGCCFSAETCDLRWAVTFPAASPPYERQVQTGQIGALGIWFEEDVALDFEKRQAAPPIVRKIDEGSPARTAGLSARQLITHIQYIDPYGMKVTHDVETIGEAQSLLIHAGIAGTKVSVITAQHPQPIEWTMPATSRTLPVQPTQIYSAIDAGLLCLFLLAYEPFRRRDGELMVLMLALHAVSRYLLESIRNDEGKTYLGMSISQVISVLMLAAAAALLAYILRQPKRRLAAAA